MKDLRTSLRNSLRNSLETSRNRTRSFTLIEVLVSITIIALLTGAVMSFLFTLLTRRDTLRDVAADLQVSNVVIERIENDLLAGLAGGASIGSGIVGSTNTIRLMTRGVSLPGLESDSDDLGDLQGSEYVFDAETHELRGRRWFGSASAGSGSFDVISGRVQRFSLRYFNGTAWGDSFDSGRSGTLPVAVEVAIWFGAPPSPDVSPFAPIGGDEADRERFGAGQDEEFGSFGSADDAFDPSFDLPSAFLDEPEEPIGPPDRLRIIIVPDGPTAGWRRSS